MGSSYGGLAIANAANRLLDRDMRIVLMAPAFGLAENFQKITGEKGLDEWQNSGYRPYFHHGLNKEIKLNKRLFELSQHLDFSEFCITSKSSVVQSDSDEIIVITKKAEGSKCPTCWKVKLGSCERSTCPI